MVKFVDASDVAFLAAAPVGAFKGAVKNLNNNVYHALKSYVSSTDLKYMYANSPAHYKAKYFPRLPEEESRATEAMILGSLVHNRLLEPEKFSEDFFIMPDLNFRTNEGKARREELLNDNPGKRPISDELLAQANAMRESALSNPKVRALLEPGYKEAAFFWECPFSNIHMKAKLDQASSGHFVELKTTSDAGPENFSRHIHNMNYDLSLFHYQTSLKQVMDLENVAAYFVVIENEPPYVTQVYRAGDGCWMTGHEKWLSAVTKLEAGIKKNEWPGYFPNPMDVPDINPPAWVTNKLMKDESNGI